MKQDDGRVYFCPTPSYRPLPDVYIEHGHAYHFWCCDRSGLRDAPGHGRTAHPQVMTLPLEGQYMQHVGYPVLAHYPYLAGFEPSMSITPQTALLCLLNPAVMVEVVQHVQDLLDADAHGQPRKGLLPLVRSDECSPVTLFEQAMMALLAFQQQVVARSPGWKEPLGEEAALQAQAQAMMELAMLRETLSRVGKDEGVTEAIATICTPAASAIGDSVAAGCIRCCTATPRCGMCLRGIRTRYVLIRSRVRRQGNRCT